MIWIRRLPLPLTVVSGVLFFFDLFRESAYLGAILVLIAIPISIWNIVSAPRTLEKPGPIVAATYESWLSIIGSVVLIISNLTPIGKLSGLIKPDYGIVIDHSELTLGRAAHLKLDASWKDGTPKPNLDDYRCDWHFDPPVPNQPRQGECNIEITDIPELFRPGGPAVVTTKVWLTATPPWGGPVVVAPPKSYTLSMHNISAPVVSTSLAALELGQKSTVKVDFPNGVRPKRFTCSWTPSGLFERPDACDTLLIAPDNLGQYPNGLSIAVAINSDGMTIQSDPFTINLKLPPARFYDFVLDATENMAAVYNGETLFDREKEVVNSQINRFGPNGGWLAITAFGHDVANATDDCARHGVIYPVAPLKPDTAQEAVNKLQIIGHVAPIAAAIDTAVKQFSALRPTYSDTKMKPYLIVITASANGCQGIKFADAVAEIGTAFASNNINYEHYGRRILSAVVAVRTSPDKKIFDEYLDSSSYNSMNNPAIVFAVDPGDQENQVIKALADLSDSDRSVQEKGCRFLENFLSKEGNKHGERTLRQQCSS